MAWNDCKAIQMGHSTCVLIGRPAKVVRDLKIRNRPMPQIMPLIIGSFTRSSSRPSGRIRKNRSWISPASSLSASAKPMYSAPYWGARGRSVTPIAADIVVLGPPEKTRDGLSNDEKSTPQMAAYIPKCGGSPASVVENAMACGSVTTASVRPMRRFARAAGMICGNALAKPSAAALIGGIVVQRLDMAVAERVGVAGERRHHRHHELLPRGGERALLVACRPRQSADVVANVAAVLVGKPAFFVRRHVAADEAGNHGIDAREVHARVETERIRSGECREHGLAAGGGAKSLRAMAARAVLAIEVRAPHVVVAPTQRRRHRDLVDALLRIAVADFQIDRGREEARVCGDIAQDVIGRVRLEAVRGIDVALHLSELVGQEQPGEAVVHVGHHPRGREAVGADEPVALGVLLVAERLVAVVATRGVAPAKPLGIPPLAVAGRGEFALHVVDNVAAALDGADVGLAVAARGDRLLEIRRAVDIARRETVAVELRTARRCQAHRGMTQRLALGMLALGEHVEVRGGEDDGADVCGDQRAARHVFSAEGSAPSPSCMWWATARARMRRSRTVGS